MPSHADTQTEIRDFSGHAVAHGDSYWDWEITYGKWYFKVCLLAHVNAVKMEQLFTSNSHTDVLKRLE